MPIVEIVTPGYVKVIEVEKAFPPAQNSVNERYSRVFSSSELNVNNEIVIQHNFAQHPTTVRILDGDRNRIYPDNERDIDTGLVKAVVLNLFSFIPFTDYLVVLEV